MRVTLNLYLKTCAKIHKRAHTRNLQTKRPSWGEDSPIEASLPHPRSLAKRRYWRLRSESSSTSREAPVVPPEPCAKGLAPTSLRGTSEASA